MTTEIDDKTKRGGKQTRPKKTPPPGATYEVGYARTPEHRKFQKGQSGNPRGRPKYSKKPATLLMECLAEKIEVNDAGKRKMMTKYEAMIRVQINNALKGDKKAFTEIRTTLEKHGQFETKPQRSGVFVAPAPVTYDEFIKLSGEIAKGDRIPQEIWDSLKPKPKKE